MQPNINFCLSLQKLSYISNTFNMDTIEEAIKLLVRAEVEKQLAGLKLETKTKTYKEFVGVSEASEITGLAVRTIYQMSSNKTIPGVRKLGKKLLFSSVELFSWIDSNRISTQAATNKYVKKCKN